ncbi:MAG: secretion protein [Synergistaceae bacterium]|jgi:type IV pilus assembly protein PilQ|nr:secretion protein [Synergistaceae bacterium]MDD3963538.1 secretion protein [Synergistaceae bacterium]
MAVCSVSPAYAVTTTAKTGEPKSVIEGMKVRQIGSNQVMLELRGTSISLPVQGPTTGSAITLVWKDIRFPRNTDKKDWWDEYGWDILRLKEKESEEWYQEYEYNLVQRISVLSNDQQGLTMGVVGEKPLILKKITGMPGSDRITLTLETVTDIVPPSPPKPRPAVQGDPLGMYSPVTLELRDISVREVFRMLADLHKLNLVIDSSVPDNLMTFSFKNAKFSEVFAYMLRMNDLTYALMGNTLVVGTSESIGKTLGKNITKEYKVAYGDIAKMPAIIMGLVTLPKPPVVDERLRALYVTGTSEQHIEVESLMNRIDHPGKQVMLEARLIEINDGAQQEIETLIASVYKGWLFTYGAQGLTSEYTYANDLVNITPNVKPSSTTTPGQLPILGSDSTMPVNIVDPTMKMLDAGLRAMESDNKGKILANPSVVALDGQKASIKLTHNYLYQSGLDESGNPEFTEQETGPTLDITPTIGRDGFVTLKLKISTGEIVQFRDSGISEVPETTKREVDTQIRVRNGELFVIGGLYQENKTKGVTRVPILGYIPLIGELFKSKTDKHSKSEMAFIVMPHILDVPTGSAEIFDMPAKSLIQ